MNPTNFPEANKTLTAPAGMDNCGSLATYSDGETCLSCWRPSWRERLSIAIFGRVWLWVWSGRTQPPVSLLGARTVFHPEATASSTAPLSLGLIVVALTLTLSGCAINPTPQEPQDPAAALKALVAALCPGADPAAVIGVCLPYVGQPSKVLECVTAACAGAPAPRPEPRPSVTAVSTPRATPSGRPQPSPTTAPTQPPAVTASPVPTVTATPSTWTTRLLRVQGFDECNASRGPGRTSCHVDRTFHFTMPGFDRVPQYAGMGCEMSGNTAFRPAGFQAGEITCGRFDGRCFAGRCPCICRDDAQSPCGGSPACDGDHFGCERVKVGCNGHSWDDPRGSILSASGITCVEGNGYSAVCSGAPGAAYRICARPYPDAHTEDGTPILVQGTGESCTEGKF